MKKLSKELTKRLKQSNTYFSKVSTQSREIRSLMHELGKDGTLDLKILEKAFNKRSHMPELDINSDTAKKILEYCFKHDLVDYEIRDGAIRRKQYKPITLKFTCNSGRIVVRDDLRSLYGEEHCDNIMNKFDINTTIGLIKTTKAYHKKDMLHGFVGNSCPGIFLDEVTGNIEIGTTYEELADDDMHEPNPINTNLKHIGSICTDLWWYSIIDYDKFIELGGNVKKFGAGVIEIPKGEYILEHYYGVSSKGYHPNEPYAKLIKQKEK